MMLEVSREVFKQRLEEPLNFKMINISGDSNIEYENTEKIPFDDKFGDKFSSKVSDKKINVLIFSLVKGDETPKMAAEKLRDLGYEFVYFYRGSHDDIVLDKGLN